MVYALSVLVFRSNECFVAEMVSLCLSLVWFFPMVLVCGRHLMVGPFADHYWLCCVVLGRLGFI